MVKIKVSPFLKNILSTTTISLCVTASLIMTTKVLAAGLGPEGFGVYSLSRRFIANASPLVLLSMGVSLRRYVAMSSVQYTRSSYLLSAVGCVSILIVFFSVVGWAGDEFFCRTIFHDVAYINTLYACIFYIGCYCFWGVTSAFLFGMQRVGIVNFFQLLIGAVFPLVVAYSLADSQPSSVILICIGAGHLICLFVLVPALLKVRFSSLKSVILSLTELTKYGLPRVPGDFLFAGLFSLGPFLAAYFGGIKQAGFFVIAQYIFRVMEAGVSAFGQVALPKIAQLVAQKKYVFLKQQIEQLIIMIFQIGLFITIHLSFWVDEIVLIWLGEEYMASISIIQILIFALGPYLAYILLRSVIDGVEVRAVNTMNLFISLLLAIVTSLTLYYCGFALSGLAVGSAVGFAGLGVLTILYLTKRFGVKWSVFLSWPILMANVFMALIVFSVKVFFAQFQISLNLLLSGLLVEVFLFFGYLIFLYKMNSVWLWEIKKRVIKS
ncbi:lipopolysaccharide biosynthesis protein [uncultured Desulfobacter sp.]|uniref:lipopolysaccharide biosynthesis protein n=1 Tax=uncultured Desulfobacter sp. TaxID=240139 RepID=UPI0029F58BE7|nr:lipopolysaccharide biosynthesis protein [uncultured Desulfobacter sp.]